MSHDTRRRVVFALVALLVVAMVLALVGCTTTAGDADDPTTPLTTETYPVAMEEICDATSAELDAVPAPPEQISLGDWAAELARILGNEVDRFDELRVTDELSEAHGTLTRTAREQADQFALLAAAVENPAGDDTGESIGAINDEIRSLSLGREEVAIGLAVPACGTRVLA